MTSYLEYRLLLIHSNWNLAENGDLKILSNKQKITNYKIIIQIEEGTCYPLRPKAYSEILHNIMRKPNPIKIYNSMQSVIGRKTDAPSTEIIETQHCKPLTISR